MFINSLFHRVNGTVLLIQQTEACVLWMLILFPMESAGCWLTIKSLCICLAPDSSYDFFLNCFSNSSEGVHSEFLRKFLDVILSTKNFFFLVGA